MNILLYDIGSFTQKDLIFHLKKAGHSCRNILYKQGDNPYEDDFFEYKFEEQLKKEIYDCVISTNFSPIVAKLCDKHQIKYIAWVYDSPINTDKIEYYQYPTSYIFLFDRLETERIQALGGINIFHLPLAVNTHRLDQIKITKEDIQNYSTDISFIGTFYSSPLKQFMSVQKDYEKGYIDAIVDCQLQIYGYNFVEEMITDELHKCINKQLQSIGYKGEALAKRGIVHSINKMVTHTERLVLLNMLGYGRKVTYYSTEQPSMLSHLSYRGTANYFTEMPKIFHLSNLNLNPTLKSIQSGIPLRALDILACKGVLFSNYQPELLEYFEDGEDLILYESIEDAVEKADFYLSHPELLLSIRENGYQKVKLFFRYPEKIEFMLKTAGL